jgi:hypothetical protein
MQQFDDHITAYNEHSVLDAYLTEAKKNLKRGNYERLNSCLWMINRFLTRIETRVLISAMAMI